MRKLLKKLLLFIVFLLLILTIIVAIKTVGFTSKQIDVEAVEAMPISDDVLKSLSEAVQIPTVSRVRGQTDSAAFRQFYNFIDSQFVLADSLLEKYTVNEFSRVYKWPGRNARLKPVLFMGHTDVVPVEDLSLGDWIKDPFGGEIADGFIWGRGTLDDKINIIGILEAIEILLRENYEPERTLYFSFGHDEEVTGLNGAKAIANQFEEQGISFEYILDEGSIMMENAMPGLSAPVALIGVAEKGYTTLSLTAQLKQGGHSSMPPKETAVGVLSKAIYNLQQNPFPAQLEGATHALFNHVGPEMQLPEKAIFANFWLFGSMLKKELSNAPSTNAMIRTTTAPTMLRGGIKENVLPSQATAKVNFRILPGEDADFVYNHAKKIINDPRVLIIKPDSITTFNPSPVSDINSFGFKVIQRSVREVFPEAVVAPSLVIAITDTRYFNKLSDNIFRFTPVLLTRQDLDRIHGLNERLSIKAYKDAIRFYKQILINSSR